MGHEKPKHLSPESGEQGEDQRLGRRTHHNRRHSLSLALEPREASPVFERRWNGEEGANQADIAETALTTDILSNGFVERENKQRATPIAVRDFNPSSMSSSHGVNKRQP